MDSTEGETVQKVSPNGTSEGNSLKVGEVEGTDEGARALPLLWFLSSPPSTSISALRLPGDLTRPGWEAKPPPSDVPIVTSVSARNVEIPARREPADRSGSRRAAKRVPKKTPEVIKHKI
ncbi:uncharacterized protein LOC144588961 [Pogona vitticeps]